MRLILDNEFTWDGLYSIVDEDGFEMFSVEALIEDDRRRVFVLGCTLNELEDYFALIDSEPETDEEKRKVAEIKQDPRFKILAEVQEKRHITRAKYFVDIGNTTIGEMERTYKSKEEPYDTDFKNNMMVSGSISDWAFRIVDKKGDVALSAVSGENLALEYNDKSKELTVATMLLAMAALEYDLRDAGTKAAEGLSVSKIDPVIAPKFMRGTAQGSGVEDAINILRDGAEKAGEFGQKAADAGKKALDTTKKGLNKGEQFFEKIFLSEEDRNR